MHVRPYTPADASPTLDVFRRAVRVTASADYSPEQIAAWSSDDIDPREWATQRLAASTVVAVDEGRVVGFSDVDARGYVDMMFVDPDFSRRGVGTLLLAAVVEVAALAGATELTADVSLTARGFFERHGFTVLAEGRPVIRGVELSNSAMRRALPPVGP